MKKKYSRKMIDYALTRAMKEWCLVWKLRGVWRKVFNFYLKKAGNEKTTL